jgi:hypothetical protein
MDVGCLAPFRCGGGLRLDDGVIELIAGFDFEDKRTVLCLDDEVRFIPLPRLILNLELRPPWLHPFLDRRLGLNENREAALRVGVKLLKRINAFSHDRDARILFIDDLVEMVCKGADGDNAVVCACVSGNLREELERVKRSDSNFWFDLCQ